jgi:cyclic di-GMP phosphodiesterase
MAGQQFGPSRPVIADSPPSHLPPGRVLILDDEPAARKLLAGMLADSGIPCTMAASGYEALRALETEPCTAVLADLRMPGMSGMQFLARVRPIHPHLAFLIVTGVDDIQVAVEAIRCGADDYLLKPLQLEVVITSLRRALEKKHLERQLENYKRLLEEMVRERTMQLESALQGIERSYGETLQALGAASDLRDGATAGHSERVALYSLRIARELNVPEQEQKTITMGAWLHDIGKLAIPDAVLLKPGPLTEDEWRVMRTHVQIGYDLIKRIAFLAAAADIILTHHERCNGSGYPRHLSGTQIPFGAKVFAVADTVDAMTSNRPYRSAYSFDEARDEISSGLGARYDSQVASTFLRIPIVEWEAIRCHSAGA